MLIPCYTIIDGVQRQGVGCIVKHMVCNDSETDRRTMNVVVDEATLREVYFWPFEVGGQPRRLGHADRL